MMVLYGLGTTIGAGIYALIGKVAGAAGGFAPLSFLVASLLAGLTAFTFAELVARFPSSAGEARYVREGLNSATLSLLVGLMVIVAGIVSSAAIVNGFAGYLGQFVDLPRPISVSAVVILLGLIAAWGIGQSVLLAGLLTLIEVGGLILVIWAGGGALTETPLNIADYIPPLEIAPWSGILAGSFLAFFAFIGFEDMVNVAEEVKEVRRALPIAIILTLFLTLLLYLAVSIVAVRALPLDQLAASDAPLALIYQQRTGSSSAIISAIALLATVNGALVQIIMASRVLYGLAVQGLLPAALARVSPKTQTPMIATALVTGSILTAGVLFHLEGLAETTSVITLAIFTLVNLALWRIKLRGPAPAGLRAVPFFVPVIGFFTSLGFVVMAALRFLTG